MTIAIYGAGTKETAAIVQAAGLTVCAVWDDNRALHGETFAGVPITPHPYLPSGELANAGLPVLNAVCGSTIARARVWQTNLNWDLRPYTFISLTSTVRAVPGDGTYITDHVVVQEGARIGKNVVLYMGSLIGHDSYIGPHAILASGVKLGGRATVGEGAFVGMGACILPEVDVGPYATIGAGAVVVRDVPAGEVVVGNPARPLPSTPCSGMVGLTD